jgi:hypothetical protein
LTDAKKLVGLSTAELTFLPEAKRSVFWSKRVEDCLRVWGFPQILEFNVTSGMVIFFLD